MPPKPRYKRLLVVLAVAAGTYVVVCWLLAGKYLSPPRTVPASTPPFLEGATIETRGGANPTWVSKNLAKAPAVIVLAFGNGGTRASFASLAEELTKRGYATVIPCMPGQDASPEPTIGFGRAEARTLEDTVAWIDAQRPDHPKVVLLGVSMGGAACWMAVEDHIPVDGIVTESAYAELAPAVDRFFNRALPFGSVLFRPVVWFAQMRSGLRVGEVKPVRGAEAWRGKPGLVIQAGDDNLVSPSQGEELSRAAGAELWLIPGASHAGCFDYDPNAYVTKLAAFVDNMPGR